MKILIFAPYYLPHNYGITVCIDEFTKFISPKVDEITIVTPFLFKNSLENERIYNNVEIIRYPAFYLVYNYPFPKFWKIKAWKILIYLFKKHKEFDLAITTIRFFPLTLFGALYAKFFGIKLMHIEQVGNHSILSSRLKTSIAKLYDYTFGRLVFFMADINVAPSTDTKIFINKFDKRNVPVIFNSLNWQEIEKFLPDLETRNKYEDRIIICYPGRLCKWKGIENSIEIIKSLPENIKKKLIFLIIGTGEDLEEIKKLALGDNSIEILGELPRKKVIGILKIADIYLHSVLQGGALSNSLLEAMYCKCAVLATPNEGAKDVIVNENNGLLAYNKDQMRHALIELVENREKRINFGQKAKETIMNKFNWDKSISEYWQLIKNL
jgi:glycosyltransferase involved in cell wall biosynthesis